jgi:hypothetical protein
MWCGTECTHSFFLWLYGPTRATACSFLRFLDYTQRGSTVGGTPLDGWSVRRRYFYLTTHTKRQTFVLPMGFETTIPASEWPQTHVTDRAATGFEDVHINFVNLCNSRLKFSGQFYGHVVSWYKFTRNSCVFWRSASMRDVWISHFHWKYELQDVNSEIYGRTALWNSNVLIYAGKMC